MYVEELQKMSWPLRRQLKGVPNRLDGAREAILHDRLSLFFSSSATVIGWRD
jgi:hypothetical protein